MLTLPMPMFGALVLMVLFLNLVLREGRYGLLAALIGLCAVQSAVIALAQHYGFGVARMVQPVTAALIPALAWVAFQATAVRRFEATRDGVHFLAPAFAAFCLAFAPQVLDVLIPALFAGYGTAMLLFLRKGADALPQMRLDAGGLPTMIWAVMAGSLFASAVSDVLIVVTQMAGFGSWQPIIISVSVTGNLLLVGGLSLSRNLRGAGERGDEVSAVPPEVDTEADAQVMARLDGMVTQQKLYLDPDLTLDRMSRKLGVPVKQLSGAINRSTGENVSRYINARRVAAACVALEAGESVTSAMLSAGFNTKSNFNREFLRVTGTAPSRWRQAQDP